MPKRMRRARNDESLRLQNAEVNIPTDFSKGQNRARLQNFQFTLEVRSAVCQLARKRLVVRRRATRRRRNVSVDQRETIVALYRHRPVRKPCVIQRAIQKFARLISSKRPQGL